VGMGEVEKAESEAAARGKGIVIAYGDGARAFASRWALARWSPVCARGTQLISASFITG
jgi:hypothetical protein